MFKREHPLETVWQGAKQGAYMLGKEVAPIATAVGAGLVNPGLAPAGYALGRAGVKTLETATGERPLESTGTNLKGVASDYANAGMHRWELKK